MDYFNRRGNGSADRFCDIRIEELESRQFLTGASHGEAPVTHQDQGAASNEQHASSEPAAAQLGTSIRSAVAARQNDSGSESKDSQAAESDSVEAPATGGARQVAPSGSEQESSDGESPALQSSSASGDTSSQQGVSALSESETSTGSLGESQGSLVPAIASTNAASAVPEQENVSAASSGISDVTPPANPRADLLSTGADVIASTTAGPPAASQTLFGTASIAGDTTGGQAFAVTGSTRSPITGAPAGRAARFGETLVSAAIAISDKLGVRQIATEFPAVLAAVGAAQVSLPANPADPVSAAATFFHFPTINWATAMADAWESFAQENLALPLAQAQSVRAWVVTTAVGAVDAVLFGYWVWSRRRKRVFAHTHLSRTPELFE